MRLLTWNLNHRARPRAFRSGVSDTIQGLAPDVAVLTEYVEGPSHAQFLAHLTDIGLAHSRLTAPRRGENQLLIASRTRLDVGKIKPPNLDASVPSNVMHVRLPGLDILGLRIPDYSPQPALRRECWSWIGSVAAGMQRTPSVIIGDFNTDPAYPRAKCGDRIPALVASGWTWAEAIGWSYTAPNGAARRLDHAFVSPHFRVTGAEYVRSAFSDHAALVVDSPGPS